MEITKIVEDKANILINETISAFETKQLIKITLSNKKNKNDELQRIIGKRVNIKNIDHLSLTYRYKTRDEVKNYVLDDVRNIIRELLNDTFYQVDLFTIAKDIHFISYANGKASLKHKKHQYSIDSVDTAHDKGKKRLISAEHKNYLHALGITTQEGKVKSDRRDKYKQINKYIEIIDAIIRKATLKPEQTYEIVDMGAGKGYLTFALYDHLTNNLGLKVKVRGIELRKSVVDTANKIAEDAGFSNLVFEEGSIQDTDIQKPDILIALHACDTATDDAIYKGIKAECPIIICAPCCHKQVRKNLNPTNVLQTITNHGILMERQSEILTDTIRSLLLEAYGYKTKVFEFINTVHTPKNVMITATKEEQSDLPNKAIMEKITGLKALYGISHHYLQELLSSSN